MKRILTAAVLALALGACGSNSAASPAVSEPAAQTPELSPVSAVPEETSAPRTESADALRAYQEHMENYEDLEITLLGAVSMDRPLEAVLERAEVEGIVPVSDIDDSRIFYGDRGEYTDYVYLIVPASDTGIRIGRYSWYAGEITETWVEEEDALPLIYVESGDVIDPQGKIEYIRHFPDGDTEGFLYTGLTADRRMRTDYHMGVVDRTDYSRFDSSEIPFYKQYLFDTLLSYEEIEGKVSSGASLNMVEEMIRDGHAYMVYDLSAGDESTLYGITYDPLAQSVSVIASYDRGVTWQPVGRG